MECLSFTVCPECGKIIWIEQKNDKEEDKKYCAKCYLRLKKNIASQKYSQKADKTIRNQKKNRKRETKKAKIVKLFGDKKISVDSYKEILRNRPEQCFGAKCDRCGDRNMSVEKSFGGKYFCQNCRDRLLLNKKKTIQKKRSIGRRTKKTTLPKKKIKAGFGFLFPKETKIYQKEMPIKKKCSECDTEFIVKGPTHRFCNDCAKERKSKACRDWQRNRDKKIRQSNQKEKLLIKKNCEQCGTEFTAKHKDRRFCDDCGIERKIKAAVKYRQEKKSQTPSGKPNAKKKRNISISSKDERCKKCGSELEEFQGIKGRFICSNPNCRRRYTRQP